MPVTATERFVFQPQGRDSEKLWLTPPPGLEPLSLRAGDGRELRGWIARGEGKKASIVFFYGNAASVRGVASILRWIARQTGCSTVCYDYRGYGFTGGVPTLQTVRDDALTIAHHTMDQLQSRDIALWGWSFGTMPAVHVATNVRSRAVVLVSPPASAADMAQHFKQDFVPAFLGRHIRVKLNDQLRRGLDTVDEIRSLTSPLLVMHGSADRLVPIDQGRAVFAHAASAHKAFVELPGKTHHDIALGDTTAGRESIAFLSRYLA